MFCDTVFQLTAEFLFIRKSKYSKPLAIASIHSSASKPEVIVIADSPYDMQGLALRPPLGFAAGVGCAFMMLPIIFFLQPLSKLLLTDILEDWGVVVLSGNAAPGNLIFAGLILHLLLGGILGLLYALCQTRVGKKETIGVGISYGFALWLLGSLVTVSFYRDALHGNVHSWVWLVASLIYGFCLAQVVLWVERNRPKQERTVPID